MKIFWITICMQNGVIKSYINHQNITQCTTAMTAVVTELALPWALSKGRSAGCAYALSAMALVQRAIRIDLLQKSLTPHPQPLPARREGSVCVSKCGVGFFIFDLCKRSNVPFDSAQGTFCLGNVLLKKINYCYCDACGGHWALSKCGRSHRTFGISERS